MSSLGIATYFLWSVQGFGSNSNHVMTYHQLVTTHNFQIFCKQIVTFQYVSEEPSTDSFINNYIVVGKVLKKKKTKILR